MSQLRGKIISMRIPLVKTLQFLFHGKWRKQLRRIVGTKLIWINKLIKTARSSVYKNPQNSFSDALLVAVCCSVLQCVIVCMAVCMLPHPREAHLKYPTAIQSPQRTLPHPPPSPRDPLLHPSHTLQLAKAKIHKYTQFFSAHVTKWRNCQTVLVQGKCDNCAVVCLLCQVRNFENVTLVVRRRERFCFFLTICWVAQLPPGWQKHFQNPRQKDH